MLQLDRPGVACTVAVSLVTAVAALLPATARADDPLSAVATVVPLADTTPVATDAIVSSAPELAPPLEQVSGVDATAPAVPVADEAPTAEPEPEPTVAAAEPAAAPSAPEPAVIPVSESDTTPAAADIATDTPVAAPVQAEQPASGTPAQADTPPTVAANVNVSVRIGSPGDNGPVTQLNVPVGGASGGGTDATLDRVDHAPATEPAATSGATQSPVETSTGEWYWNWDCLGPTSGGTISPRLPEGVSFPTSWTWNWNCGDNSSEYQDETSGRYQQINTNISIRISSPGNDGSVSQVNVGAAFAVSLPVPVRGLPAPVGSAPLFPVPVSTVLDTVLEAPASMLAPVSSDTTATGLSVAPTELGPSEAVAAAPPSVVAARPAATMRPIAGLGAPQWGRAWWYPTAGGQGHVDPTTSVLHAWQSAKLDSAPAAHTTTSDRATDPSPHRRAPLPGRVPIVATSGASATAGSAGGGGSGSGIPALLLLPLVAILLDLARRVALEHAALPIGHWRRAPDRPG